MPATGSLRAAPDTARAARGALLALQIGAFACVIAVLPYRVFELDRYTVPKELVLHASALVAGILCLRAARRLSVFAVDILLLAFLLLSLLSTLFATNRWLAAQAVGVSVSGAVLFWTARTVTRAGYGRPLLAALAAAVGLGAATALAQAYGLIASPLFNLTRAPGGTFGNRNFVAHVAAIGLPVLLLVGLEARRRAHVAAAAIAVTLVVAALFLSRSRGAWLAAAASGTFLLVEGVWLGRLWQDAALRSRLLQLGGAAAIGVLGAWVLPNRLNWRSDSPYLESLAGMTNYKEGSGRGRLIQYGNTLTMAAAHPVLGVGPGNWPVHYPRFMSPNDPSFDADDFIPTNPWPSSDWMAFAAERGFLASVLLAGVGALMSLGAWARLRRVRNTSPGGAVRDLAIVATVMGIAVVGAFDAVLLLPTPTFFAWATLGALASSARPVRQVTLTPAARRRVVAGVAVLGGLLVARSVSRIAAMDLYDGGARPAQEWAARVDPGSYRIHMLLGLARMRERRCTEARPHAARAVALFPHYPAPRRMLRACGARRLVSLVTATQGSRSHIPYCG